MSFESELCALRPRLMSFARHLTKSHDRAEDLVQITMMRAIIHKSKFEPGTNLAAWTTTIMRNEFYTALRKTHREVPDVEGYFANTLIQIPNQVSAMEHKEFQEVFKVLPEAQREAIELIGIQGYDYDTAGEMLGVPAGTVKSRVSRGRSMLIEMMGKDFSLDHITLGVIGYNESQRSNYS